MTWQPNQIAWVATASGDEIRVTSGVVEKECGDLLVVTVNGQPGMTFRREDSRPSRRESLTRLVETLDKEAEGMAHRSAHFWRLGCRARVMALEGP